MKRSLFLLVLCVAFVVLMTGCPSATTSIIVPDVAGQSQLSATQTLESLALRVTPLEMLSTTVPIGQVIRTIPAAGSEVPSGTVITIVVSARATNVTVPDVINLHTTEAVTTLINMQLNIGTLTYEASSATVGTVIGQTPAAGNTVAAGTLINLSIANGPEMVTVPDLGVGIKTQDDAVVLLTQLGLVLGTVTQVYDVTHSAGSIIAQTILPETTIPAGSSIGITIVRAAAPNVVGLLKNEAVAAITAISGLTVNPTFVAATAPANQQPLGTVTAQSFNATTGVVTLTISSRTVPLWSDHAAGLTLNRLKADLAAAGLTYGGFAASPIPNPVINRTWAGLYQSSTPISGTVLFEDIPVTVSLYAYVVPSLLGLSVAGYPNIANTNTANAGLTLLPDSTAGGGHPGVVADYVPTMDATILGTIAQQDPAANTALFPDDNGVVDITVRIKIYGTFLPYVIGMNENAAVSTLQALQPTNSSLVSVLYVAPVLGTDAEFDTVKTERVKDALGDYTINVPSGGLLSTGPIQLGVAGLPIPSTDAGGALDVSVAGTRTRLQAINAVNAVHTTLGSKTLPYTEHAVSVTATPANLGKLVTVTPLSPAGATYAISVDLGIGGLEALNVVGKTIGASGDNVASGTAWGILTGAAQVAANKFPVATVSVTETAAETQSEIGKVIEQVPPVVAPATSVTCYAISLKVGAGVPNVVGDWALDQYDNSTPPVLTATGALTELTEFGLTPLLIWLYDPDVNLGRVVTTLPAPGAYAVRGQTINVYVSGVKVPNFIGMTGGAAAAYISNPANNLSIGVFTGGGTVISQTPAANTVVEPGTAVSFTAAK